MTPIYIVLLVLTYILGAALIGYGTYAFLKQEVQWFVGKKDITGIKIQGKEARKYAAYYIIAGILWLAYAIARTTGILE